jgi:hypothetical protein
MEQTDNQEELFPRSDNKAKGVLDIVHSDMCGPMKTTSLSRYVHYVSFIDDFSHKNWIYFLKTKSEVFNKFKEFKALVENISEKKRKTLRSDNGGEFTSDDFKAFCGEVGIKRELTTPYSPQQNGVAERKNRTITVAGNGIVPEEHVPENHDMTEPQRPVEMITKKRRPSWAHEIIQDVEKYGAPDGSFRENKKPRPYSSYVALLCDIIDVEPTCYEEAAEKKVWKDAMIEEYQSIIKNDVWDVVPRLKEKSIVSSKWIYKTKHSTDGSIEKYKERFVARGFSQKEGIDYEETFSPVVRYTSIRAILVITTVMKWKVHQMDVKTTFLNGVVEEEVYVE